MAQQPDEKAFANDFLRFVNNCASHFHAVEESKARLVCAGYTEISEKNDTDFKNLKPGGKYFFTRNQSTIFAFAIGEKWAPGNGFVIQAAHTDSPVLKVKPVSKKTAHGFLQIGVECYGGGLWNTWFDRDLSLAGRVIVDKGTSFESTLVRINRPILRIPNLAIHLNREIYSEGFKPNKETHTVPILATQIKAQLDEPAAAEPDAKRQKVEEADHHPALLDVLADELQVKVEQIKDFELSLYDCQPAALTGLYDEFIAARGLDNLCMSFVTLQALIDTTSGDASTLADESQIRLVALFDNEEIGSSSAMGAASNMMDRVLMRLNKDADSYDSSVRKSVVISCDMAHAVHPNYAEKHESNHRPAIHKGLVIKQNANQRYATTSVTSFLLSQLAATHNIPLQKFVVRNDVGCGSTIGPILSSNTGIRTIDVGVPQLAMHSVREMCGTADCLSSYVLMKAVFNEFAALDAKLVNAD